MNDYSFAKSGPEAQFARSPRAVLITGGSEGIGAATAAALLGGGSQVAITGRRADRLRAFATDHDEPQGLLTLPGDAGDPVSVANAVDQTVTAFGRLDAVIANAGYATFDTLADGDGEGWRDMILTNVLGPSLLVRTALPALRQTRGRIVLIGSVAGTTHIPGNIYGVTKWAVTGLAENTRRMVTGEGVGVTLINPGTVDAPNFYAAEGSVPDAPMLTPAQIASAVVWTLTQPPGVDVNTLTIRPIGMAV